MRLAIPPLSANANKVLRSLIFILIVTVMDKAIQRRMDNVGNKSNRSLKNTVFFAGLYIAMVSRYFMQGIQYYTYTDDNNQYGVYFRRALDGDIWNDIIMYYRRFFERPLAFLSDAYIFQRFFQNMHILLIIITTMYFLICFLLYKTFNKLSIRFGLFGVIFLALIPCGYEAAYWISASSRIVVSMFFAVLSAWLFFGGIEKVNRKILITLSAAANLMSLLYYEQTALFSFSLFLVCAIAAEINKNDADKRLKYKIRDFIVSMTIPVINIIITASYYIYFMFFSREVISESRNKLVTGSFIDKAVNTTKDIIVLIQDTMITFNWAAIKKGFGEPVTIGVFIALIILIAFMVITFIAEGYKENSEAKKAYIIKFIAGFILSFAPLSIFYLLQNVYFEPRMLFPSFVGFAVLLDLFFDIVTAFYKPMYTLKRIAAVSMIIPFFLASVYITGVYKTTYTEDSVIAGNFLEEYDKVHTEATEKIYLLNTVYSFSGQKTPPLANITAADWIMLGNLNANQHKYYFRKLFLVRADGQLDASVFYDPAILVLGIDDEQKVRKLSIDSDNMIRDDSGNVFGYVREGIFMR